MLFNRLVVQNIFFVDIEIIIVDYEFKIFELVVLSIDNKFVFSSTIDYNKVVFEFCKGIG